MLGGSFLQKHAASLLLAKASPRHFVNAPAIMYLMHKKSFLFGPSTKAKKKCRICGHGLE
ncbi:MAG: hypothetical protein B7X35_05515 [Halothiobacillus sp. 14-56-357]|jgi:hypothetical protein|nr:MAG: hypothetical protein B7X44_04145 [Halothiobacillus sp. 15-55-196]OZB56446.1 MAG: hypothetical protein B7X35_05515 [Halothiobacillus sp. 14-56-357]OZB78721.1 MAG: hypothetical protein B7X29_03790 [Halothiobacillus sp. 13-55-115]